MFPYAVLVPHVAALLAYLAGLAVAIILLVRAKGRAAILAAVGFALLVLISVGQIVLALPSVNVQFFRVGQWLAWVLNCCCSMFDVAAIACLIVAIWQAVSGVGTEEVEEEPSDTAEPPAEEEEVIVDVFEEAPEAAYATAKLEDAPEEGAEQALEGEILEDTPSESPYATKVLRETPEEAADTLGEAVEESE
jgi:hypothetical protein